MTGKEFEQIIRVSFERKKFTNLIIDKKLFRNFAHVYCKSAVHPGKFHYTCTMIDMRDKPTLEVQQADVDLAVWDDQDAPAWNGGLFKIFLAEPFFAAAAGTANIAVCRNVDENCWVIRDVAACIVSIGMAVNHKNVFAAAFGANVGIFMGAHSFLRYIVTDSCAAADQILEKAGKCLKSSHRPPA